jgi:hypothetical protein
VFTTIEFVTSSWAIGGLVAFSRWNAVGRGGAILQGSEGRNHRVALLQWWNARATLGFMTTSWAIGGYRAQWRRARDWIGRRGRARIGGIFLDGGVEFDAVALFDGVASELAAG